MDRFNLRSIVLFLAALSVASACAGTPFGAHKQHLTGEQCQKLVVTEMTSLTDPQVKQDGFNCLSSEMAGMWNSFHQLQDPVLLFGKRFKAPRLYAAHYLGRTPDQGYFWSAKVFGSGAPVRIVVYTMAHGYISDWLVFYCQNGCSGQAVSEPLPACAEMPGKAQASWLLNQPVAGSWDCLAPAAQKAMTASVGVNSDASWTQYATDPRRSPQLLEGDDHYDSVMGQVSGHGWMYAALMLPGQLGGWMTAGIDPGKDKSGDQQSFDMGLEAMATKPRPARFLVFMDGGRISDFSFAVCNVYCTNPSMG